MVDIPQIAGWPADYPDLDPREQILLIHEDLEELKANPKLANSSSWLALFAANVYELDLALDRLHESSHFPKNLSEIRNWLKNGRFEGKSLSQLVHAIERTHYKDTKQLEQFLSDWISKDEIGFWSLFTLLSDYLRKRAS